jgi:hypothetical protein
VQNYIHWLISTENDHRHHHKFIKYEKRLRKEGNMLGLPINNNQALRIPRVKKDPKLSLSELLSGWQYSNLFIWPSMGTRLEHAHCLETINNMWFLGKRETVNAWDEYEWTRKWGTSFEGGPEKVARF